MASRYPRARTPLPTKKDRRLELWVAGVALVIGLVAAIWFTRNHVTAPASPATLEPTTAPATTTAPAPTKP